MGWPATHLWDLLNGCCVGCVVSTLRLNSVTIITRFTQNQAACMIINSVQMDEPAKRGNQVRMHGAKQAGAKKLPKHLQVDARAI